VPDGQVWHIHGSAAHPAEPLVLGHAWRPSAAETYSAQLDPEQADTRALEGAAIIDRYFRQSFKPTGQIIAHNQARFRALKDVTEIRVLGHSLSDVDLPYLKAIAANVDLARTRWRISVQADPSGAQSQFTKIGAPLPNAKFMPITDV
jgi:hypothetical protein